MQKKVLFIGLDIYSRSGGIARYSQRFVRVLSELCGDVIEKAIVISLWDGIQYTINAPKRVAYIPCGHNKLKAFRTFLTISFFSRPHVIIYGHIIYALLAVIGRLLCRHSTQMMIGYGIDVWGANRRPIPSWERWPVQHFFRQLHYNQRIHKKEKDSGLQADTGKFFPLPPAVDAEIRTTKPSKDRRKHILSVSRLDAKERSKGLDLVIKALPFVLKTCPDVIYDIVGEGPLKRDLANLAKITSVEEHIHFWEFISDEMLENVYQMSDVYVMPSSKEGFSIVSIEAFSIAFLSYVGMLTQV